MHIVRFGVNHNLQPTIIDTGVGQSIVFLVIEKLCDYCHAARIITRTLAPVTKLNRGNAHEKKYMYVP